MLVAGVVVACLGVALVLYGWLEAGWLRCRVVEVPVEGLSPLLDGLRIGHLSDFHLGASASRGNSASARAVGWVASRRPDLVCITGDLVSHPRGERLLKELLGTLEKPFVVLGNHDVAVTRDPFSRAAELRDLERATLLRDEVVTLTLLAPHCRSWASTRRPTGQARHAPTSSTAHNRASASCSATSRVSLAGCL